MVLPFYVSALDFNAGLTSAWQNGLGIAYLCVLGNNNDLYIWSDNIYVT